MSDTFSSGAGAASSSRDRKEVGEQVPAYIVYALLFISPFTGGIAGLIGGVLAHVLKGPARSIAQSHIRFQLKIFWVAVVLVLPLLIGLVTGLTSFLMELVGGADITTMTVEPWVIPAVIVAGLMAGASWLWQLGASVFGIARLASNRPIGSGFE